MDKQRVTLEPFGKADYEGLIAVIPDARAHLQWAGPEYSYPLDARQLDETLAKTVDPGRTFVVFKVVLTDTGETVGHVQLMDIDHERSTCVLGKVLVFPRHRGKGLGTALVEASVDRAFAGLDLQEITLLVFEFNAAAIAVYEKIGFVHSPRAPEPLPFGGESWQAVRMVLARDAWSRAQREQSRARRARGSAAIRRP